MLRPLWFCAGMLALALGMLGAVLPLLPTTPFVLLAAYCFAHSSEKWHQWLLTHRSFGPLIRHWRDHRAISRRTKVYSVIAMGAVLLLSYLLDASNLVLSVQAAVLSGSALFILTRPEPPAEAALEVDDE